MCYSKPCETSRNAKREKVRKSLVQHNNKVLQKKLSAKMIFSAQFYLLWMFKSSVWSWNIGTVWVVILRLLAMKSLFYKEVNSCQIPLQKKFVWPLHFAPIATNFWRLLGFWCCCEKPCAPLATCLECQLLWVTFVVRWEVWLSEFLGE